MMGKWMIRAAAAGLGVLAAGAVSAENLSEQTNPLQEQQNIWLHTLEAQKPSENLFQTAPAEEAAVLTDADLQAHPEFAANLLQQVLNRPHPDLLRPLTEAYAQTPAPDRVLLRRAQGMVLRYAGKHAAAAAVYEELAAEAPDNPRVRLDLAAIEFEDKRWRDARNNFTLAQEADLPPPVRENVRRFQEAIDEQTRWQFYASLSPVYHSNANDAAPPYCMGNLCSIGREEAAYGLAYGAGASKLLPLAGNHNLLFRSHFSGTSYFFDRKSQYDSAYGRAYLGWQWQNAANSVSVLPFYQAQLAGSDDFHTKAVRNRRAAPFMNAHAIGIQTAYTRRHTPRLQSHYSWEYSEKSYREAERAQYNDGRQSSLYAALAYRLTPRHTVFGSYQFDRFRTDLGETFGQANPAANHRHSFGAGWLAEWLKDGALKSRLNASQSRRSYKGVAAFGDTRQHNRETSFSLALSHDKLQYGGIRPSLNYQYSRISSNMPWAERRNRLLFVGVEKVF